MPIIRVEMFEGRDEEQKNRLASELTQAFIESCGGKPESVHVIITDVSPQNWAVAGQLISRRNK